jgi:nitric oxide reductase large subunit
MTADDIIAGKAGFQKADLMDYGSLYGMGSYFGQDYTAFALVRFAKLTEEQLAQPASELVSTPCPQIGRPPCVRRCSGNCKGSI